MKKMKEWALLITYAAVLVGGFALIIQGRSAFTLRADGGLLSWSYAVDIPRKYMTAELATRHHEAFLDMIEKQCESQ